LISIAHSRVPRELLADPALTPWDGFGGSRGTFIFPIYSVQFPEQNVKNNTRGYLLESFNFKLDWVTRSVPNSDLPSGAIMLSIAIATLRQNRTITG
jgi:hypothetical protein